MSLSWDGRKLTYVSVGGGPRLEFEYSSDGIRKSKTILNTNYRIDYITDGNEQASACSCELCFA